MTEQVAETPQQPTEQTQQDTMPVQPDPLATLLSEIKDESGRQKYHDVETALKALKSSQEYIPQLKTELNSLKERAELQNDVKTVQELLMSTELQQTTTDQAPEVAPVTPEAQQQVEATEPSLREQFEAFLAEKTVAEKESQNLAAVQNKLSELFGEKKQEMYEAKAQELGISPEFLDGVAKKSPQAVLEYFKTTSPAPSLNSTVNTSGIRPAPQAPKNVMGASTYRDVRAAWDACHPEVFNRN